MRDKNDELERSNRHLTEFSDHNISVENYLELKERLEELEYANEQKQNENNNDMQLTDSLKYDNNNNNKNDNIDSKLLSNLLKAVSNYDSIKILNDNFKSKICANLIQIRNEYTKEINDIKQFNETSQKKHQKELRSKESQNTRLKQKLNEKQTEISRVERQSNKQKNELKNQLELNRKEQIQLQNEISQLKQSLQNEVMNIAFFSKHVIKNIICDVFSLSF